MDKQTAARPASGPSGPAMLTCAVSGGIVTGNPNQPRSRDDVIREAIAAARAGVREHAGRCARTFSGADRNPRHSRAGAQARRAALEALTKPDRQAFICRARDGSASSHVC